jgi:hypothetical protein
VAEVTRRFPQTYVPASTPDSLPTQIAYERLEGGLAGYLSAELSAHNMSVRQSVYVDGIEVDMVVELLDAAIAVELKVARRFSPTVIDQAVFRLTTILATGRFSGGGLVMSSDALDYETFAAVGSENKIKLVCPVAGHVGGIESRAAVRVLVDVEQCDALRMDGARRSLLADIDLLSFQACCVLVDKRLSKLCAFSSPLRRTKNGEDRRAHLRRWF